MISLTYGQIIWLILLYFFMSFMYGVATAVARAGIKTWKERRESKSVDS